MEEVNNMSTAKWHAVSSGHWLTHGPLPSGRCCTCNSVGPSLFCLRCAGSGVRRVIKTFVPSRPGVPAGARFL
eukprot:4466461-Amphidinium_carterae.2